MFTYLYIATVAYDFGFNFGYRVMSFVNVFSLSVGVLNLWCVAIWCSGWCWIMVVVVLKASTIYFIGTTQTDCVRECKCATNSCDNFRYTILLCSFGRFTANLDSCECRDITLSAGSSVRTHDRKQNKCCVLFGRILWMGSLGRLFLFDSTFTFTSLM